MKSLFFVEASDLFANCDVFGKFKPGPIPFLPISIDICPYGKNLLGLVSGLAGCEPISAIQTYPSFFINQSKELRRVVSGVLFPALMVPNRLKTSNQN